MQHIPALISDLALILGSASVIALVFKILKQPIVLGYLLAGLLVGPNFDLFPTVVEIKSIQTWAEIGVIFLLFGLGLEFSFKKLIPMLGIVGITAVIGSFFTMLTGYIIAHFLEWQSMDCIFFGGILAIASTTIIVRSFTELKLKEQNFASIVTGILVVEDLIAVVLMVVLSTISVSQSFNGDEAIYSIFKLVFFLILWFISGIYFLPTFLRIIKKHLTAETLLILSLGLCLGMVVLASKAGFSPALGAFIMGSILAETTKAETIERLIHPIQDMFGAIFFVSVGMLLNLDAVVEFWVPIVLGTLVLIFVKPTFVVLGSIITGQPLKTAVQTGMSLSQIGEFSFIIASLGLSLNVISPHLYPIAVAISVITTFTTPFMIKLSTGVSSYIENSIPKNWNKKLQTYSFSAQRVAADDVWKTYLHKSIVHSLIYSVIIVFIILVVNRYIIDFSIKNNLNSVLTATLSFLAISPFIWALIFKREKITDEELKKIKPAMRKHVFVIRVLRLGMALFFMGWLFDKLFSPVFAILLVCCATVILFLIRHRLRKYYYRIELRFITNLNERTSENKDSKIPTPWDTHIADFELHPLLPFFGVPLLELNWREKFGINIASIQRGEMILNIPSRNEKLFPNDVISVIGTDIQLKEFKNFIDNELGEIDITNTYKKVSLKHFTIGKNSKLIGKTIQQTALREQANALVVGVERDEQRLLNPNSDFVLQEQDIVWLVSDNEEIKNFLET